LSSNLELQISLHMHIAKTSVFTSWHCSKNNTKLSACEAWYEYFLFSLLSQIMYLNV